MTRPPLHPACSAWPDLSEADMADLVASIDEIGQVNPIILMPDGRILDGRARWDACAKVGIKPLTEIYTGANPEALSIAQNAKRRHLSKVELAMIVAKITMRSQGGDRKSEEFKHSKAENSDLKGVKEAAKAAGISDTYVTAGRKLTAHAEPNVIDMAKARKVPLRTAAAYAKHTPRDQQRKATAEQVKKEGEAFKGTKWKPNRPADDPTPRIGTQLDHELKTLFNTLDKGSTRIEALMRSAEFLTPAMFKQYISQFENLASQLVHFAEMLRSPRSVNS